MTAQQARDQQARAVVKSWQHKRLRPIDVLARLEVYASRAEHLHFTPHLLTAARELGLLATRRQHA